MRAATESEEKTFLAKIPIDMELDSVTEAQLQDCVLAVEYLNSVTGKKFKVSAKGTTPLLLKLLRKGYILDDIRLVIDSKVLEWQDVPVMRKYLQPSTLFDIANFQRYNEEARKSQNSRQ